MKTKSLKATAEHQCDFYFPASNSRMTKSQCLEFCGERIFGGFNMVAMDVAAEPMPDMERKPPHWVARVFSVVSKYSPLSLSR